jgi:predicted phosphodiesterase
MEDKLFKLVQQLRDLASEIGKTPTRREYVERYGHDFDSKFGAFSPFVLAAGLEPGKARKIDNSIFERDIVTHLDQYEAKERVPFLDIKPKHTIILGDTHFPFVHKDKLKRALDYIAFKKPERVIQVGDLYDMLSHGKFPRSLNVYTPKEEMAEGRRGAQDMWEEVRRIAPQAELHQILGNHDVRPMKRIIEQYPEAELFFDFSKWFQFDGVQSHLEMRDELILENIAYIHGYRGKIGDHMEYMRRPVVCGHLHRGGVVYKNYGDAVLWELNAGYLGDPDSKALSYTAQKHSHWTHGVGEIDQFGPRFVPL